MASRTRSHETERHAGAWGMLAMFAAGAGVAATVAVVATKAHGQKVARQTEDLLESCDEAMKKLERRLRIVS